MPTPANPKKIQGHAQRLAEPLAEAMGYGIVEVGYAKENADWFLRVFIDKPGGVSIDDCERFSRSFSDALDCDDFIPHAYTLEVSSPGIDRPLKSDEDFARHLGEPVEAWLTREEIKRRRAERLGKEEYVSGTLVAREGGALLLDDGKGGQASIPMECIAAVKRSVRI